MLWLACLVTCIFSHSMAQLGFRPPKPLLPGELEPPQTTTETTPQKDEATYWVMCSNKLRRGHDFVCMAKILAGQSPVTITITLHDYSGKKVILKSTPTMVLPGAAKNIVLPIPSDLEKPSEKRWFFRYNTTIEGVGKDVNFKETVQVNLARESGGLFVQTDKGIYKSGQFVRFRVLLTTIDLKPIRGESVNIVIEDPHKNRIWQRIGVLSPESGVIDQFSFELASRAMSGTWKIKTDVMGLSDETKFEVDDYVLPRYEVKIVAPSFGLPYNPVLKVTVKATYTFGKPVTEGRATLEISRLYSWHEKEKTTIIRSGQLDSNGEFTAEFSRYELLDYFNKTQRYRYGDSKSLVGRTVYMKANVTENNTRRTKQAVDYSLRYVKTTVKARFLEISPSSIKPGLPYTGYVEFKRLDDTPLTAEELTSIQVLINITYTVARPKTTTTTTTTTTPKPKPVNGSIPILDVIPRPIPIMGIPDIGWWQGFTAEDTKVLKINNPIRQLPASGFIPITFDIPDDVSSSVTIKVEGIKPFDAVRTTKYLRMANSPTKSYLMLSVSNKVYKIGDMVTVNAMTTTPITELSYQIFSKGLLVKTDTVIMEKASKNLKFGLTLESMMSPSVRIVAFYRREDNDEFVVDAISLSVEGRFNNPVSIAFSKDKVQPGENVDVIVKAPESSWVFLASNDKSVKLLKEGNEITQKLVKDFLWSLDYGANFPYLRDIFICGGPFYYGGSDAFSVFNAAQTLVITDGLIYRHQKYHRDPQPEASMADGAGDMDKQRPVNNFSPADKVRKFFPENWLWRSLQVPKDSNGKVIIPTKAPDTITSWVTTVFSMHAEHGLSVAEKPVELITARDMFVSLDLPVSITQGEDYCFTATVFSYYAKPLPVLLTLNKSSDFDNIQVRRAGPKKVNVEWKSSYYSYFVGVLDTGAIESAMFCFKPLNVGRIPIEVSALTNIEGLSDAVRRYITVKPEGVPRTTSRSFLVDLSEAQWTQNVNVDFPVDTVPGSQYITFSATGSFLGPVVENIDDLLRMPYGCGEQNMLNFAPTVFVTDYYFKTNTNDTEKIEKAKRYILAGYTKEMRYEHEGKGCFSTFGNDKNRQMNGSLWLTAFVTKTFAQAELLNDHQEIIPLDRSVLHRSVGWISQQMKSTGEFVEYGKVFNKRMQGGSSNGVALTAYTLIALNEASKVLTESSETTVMGKVKTAMSRGKTYLEIQIRSLSDPYDVCIVGYALQLLGSNRMRQMFRLIERKATRGDGIKYWKRHTVESSQTYAWSRPEDAISIEATAYCLLVYVERGIIKQQGLPVIRWLTNQRGPRGGFVSTQDTVVGLQALTSVSAMLHSKDDIPLSMKVTYSDANGQEKSKKISIDKTNEMMLQKVYIPYVGDAPKSINIKAQTANGQRGPTTVMAEVVWDYHVKTEVTSISYNTKHNLVLNKNSFDLEISISTRGRGESASMTILRVDIPTGYKPDSEQLDQYKFISRTDVEYSDEKGEDLVIYFDSDVIDISGISVIVTMYAPASGKLVSPTDQSYSVVNYYQPSDEITKIYWSDSKKRSFCEIADTYSFCPFVNK